MQKLGHPIACDELYGDGKPVFISALKKNFKLSKIEEEERPILNRLGLHASELSFTDQDGKMCVLKAEIPKDMRALLQQLRKWKS
jgi:23S rRNA pseudouridine955/2504/2580 synthase/23S rRNA pseudouridine1911/1915/1917 synthase